MEAATEKSRSTTVSDLQAWTYYNLYYTTSWGNLLSNLHVPHEQWALDWHFWCLFFVYGYPSSCPCAHCTPNKSVPTLRYTCRPGPFIQAMPVGTYRVQSPGFPKIVYFFMNRCKKRKDQTLINLLAWNWKSRDTEWMTAHTKHSLSTYPLTWTLHIHTCTYTNTSTQQQQNPKMTTNSEKNYKMAKPGQMF